MAVPALAGQDILASDIVSVKYYKKAATESVSSSTVYQNDDDLVNIPLAANKVFKIEFYGAMQAAAPAADFKMQWNITGGVAAIGTRSCWGPSIRTGDVTAQAAASTGTGVNTAYKASLSTDGIYGGDGSGTSGAILEVFLLETTTSGSSGTLTLQWAQNVSNASATSLTSSTYLLVTELIAG